jgi:hypothetical protein
VISGWTPPGGWIIVVAAASVTAPARDRPTTESIPAPSGGDTVGREANGEAADCEHGTAADSIWIHQVVQRTRGHPDEWETLDPEFTPHPCERGHPVRRWGRLSPTSMLTTGRPNKFAQAELKAPFHRVTNFAARARHLQEVTFSTVCAWALIRARRAKESLG